MSEKTRNWHQNSTFDPHSYNDWRASVDELLRGADFDKTLVSNTLDDIRIQPLYQQMADAPFYGRGNSTWSIQQTYSHGNLQENNQQLLSDLSDGLTSIELALPAVNSGTGDSNTLPCYAVSDLEHLLTDVHPQMIEISQRPGPDNRLTGALLLAYYCQQKIAPADVHCALNIDPLGTQALHGQCAKEAISELSQFALYCDKHFPNASSVCVDSSVYHNAGCSEAPELAFVLASTVEYLRALQSLDTNLAFNQIRYRISLDSDFFLNVAKLRAARELIRQIQQNCGAENSTIVIDATSSTRSLSTLDPSVNILRTSTQATAAMAGGANGFNCAPFDELTGSTPKARRLARNTQHILIEESGLTDINDPARGSGYVESLTADLCQAAWKLFQEIEASGGMHKSLEQGLIAGEIEVYRKARTSALATGRSAMIGVTEYPNLEEAHERASATQADNHSTASGNDTAETQSVSIPALVGALSEGKSIAEFESRGNFRVKSEPLNQFRDSHPFEQLRHKSQVHQKNRGTPPTVTLITIGSQKDYAARVAFCKNFFAVAGIDTKTTDHAGDLNNTNLAVLCSSDKKYLQEASLLCTSVKAKNLWIAGNNQEVLTALEALNVSESIHLRCDKLTLLDKAFSMLGVSI